MPAFPSPKAMSLQFTGDEIGVLYNHFLTVQAELGPITAAISDEEYEAWVCRIAEAGSADPFDLVLNAEIGPTLSAVVGNEYDLEPSRVFS